MKIFLIALISVFLVTSCSRSKREPSLNSEKKQNVKKTKPNLKLYIEYGGSMYGYFNNEVSGFKSSLSTIIGDIHLDKKQLNLIKYNRKNESCEIIENVSSGTIDITNYIDKDLFGEKLGSDRNGGSGFYSIFKEILKDTVSNTVTALVSDFIPIGESHEPKFPMKSFFKEELDKDSTFTVAIVKLSSRFHGTYYSPHGLVPKEINQYRPYYIWFFGSKDKLKETGILDYNYFTNIAAFDSFRGIAVFTNQYDKFNYSLLTNKTLNLKSIIVDSKKTESHNCKAMIIDQNDKESLQFSVAVNLSEVIREDSYIEDTANYIVSKKYKLLNVFKIKNNEIKLNDNKTQPIATRDIHYVENNKATHLLVFESENRPTNLTFHLMNKMPRWLTDSNSDSEEYIGSNTYLSSIKTVGFKCFNFGLEENFINNKKVYFTAKIEVGYKQGISNSFKFIFLIIIIGVIFYIYQRKKSN